jgi:hypothetical protein
MINKIGPRPDLATMSIVRRNRASLGGRSPRRSRSLDSWSRIPETRGACGPWAPTAPPTWSTSWDRFYETRFRPKSFRTHCYLNTRDKISSKEIEIKLCFVVMDANFGFCGIKKQWSIYKSTFAAFLVLNAHFGRNCLIKSAPGRRHQDERVLVGPPAAVQVRRRPDHLSGGRPVAASKDLVGHLGQGSILQSSISAAHNSDKFSSSNFFSYEHKRFEFVWDLILWV